MFFLVVDDDKLSRELLSLLLGAEGHEIEVADSGEEALAKLSHQDMKRRFMPNVILTDVQMPGVAGNALGKALRAAMPEGTMLLAMSGSRPLESVLRSYDGFLLKPFSVEELQEKIAVYRKKGADLDGSGISSLSECELEAGSQSTVAALNEEVYAKLSETMPAAQLGQMFSMCLTDARSRIRLMREYAAAGDDAKYRAAAHAIKGGCGFIGATELYCLAEIAEHDGLGPELGVKAGTARAASTLEQLSSASERLERILVRRARD